MISDDKTGAIRDENPGATSDEKPGVTSDDKTGVISDEKPGVINDAQSGVTNDEKPGATSDEKPGATSDDKTGAPDDESDEEVVEIVLPPSRQELSRRRREQMKRDSQAQRALDQVAIDKQRHAPSKPPPLVLEEGMDEDEKAFCAIQQAKTVDELQPFVVRVLREYCKSYNLAVKGNREMICSRILESNRNVYS